MRGRVEAGRSGGGNSYGYDVVRNLRADGTVDAGRRRINLREAKIVDRIFNEYKDGISPREIAKRLNRERVRGPSGASWSPTTINGNRERGTGILNNELYIGKLVWNRLRYMKGPRHWQAAVASQSGQGLDQQGGARAPARPAGALGSSQSPSK